jgi:hypothetical protein
MSRPSSQSSSSGALAVFGNSNAFSRLINVRSDVIFGAALVVVCGLSVFVGLAAPLGSFAHDTFFLIDNAYRVAQGQVPHRDFSSAWGPVMFLIDATGLVLSGMRPSGLGVANALFGGLFGVWAFLIVRSRWSSPSACAVGIYTMLLITAPFSISNNPFDFGYAMSYNRYGFALFGIVIMECVALNDARVRRGFVGAISTGIAIALLAFLKISFALVAIPFVGVLTLAAGAGRIRRITHLSAGFGVMVLLVLCYLRFDLSDMLRDLAMAATARRQSLHPLIPIRRNDVMPNLFIVLFTVGLAYNAAKASGRDRAVLVHGVILALLTIASGYLLLISNQQADTFPLNGYTAVALVGAGGPLMTGKPLRWPSFNFTPGFPRALLLGVCLLPLSLENGISLAGAAAEREWPRSRDAIVLAPPERGADFLFRQVTGPVRTETIGAAYVTAVDDGLALLRRHSGSGDGVLTVDEFNPFNYLLDRPSPRGGFAAAANNYIFCDAAHPTAERFLGDTNYVMVRKYNIDDADSMEHDDVAALMRIYGSALRSEFNEVEETDHWVLWHRMDPARRSMAQ